MQGVNKSFSLLSGLNFFSPLIISWYHSQLTISFCCLKPTSFERHPLISLITFQLLTPCVFLFSTLIPCVRLMTSALQKTLAFGLDHTRGRRRLVCKTQIKQPGWGIVLDRPFPLVNITSSAAFWTALPQLHHFI